MQTHFQKSMDFVLWWETKNDPEGAYHIDPDDPGGPTKWGISQKAYPSLDIQSITKHGAFKIYDQDYWRPCKCQDMPWPLGMAVFDTAVNVGTRKAVKMLQAVVMTSTDGIVGSKTLAALQAYWKNNKRHLLNKYMQRRIAHYYDLNMPEHLEGWVRRVADLCLQVGCELDII